MRYFALGVICPFNTIAFPGPNYFQFHTQNTPAGTYTFTLSGSSSGVTHTASAQITVTSGTFTGSVSPTTATISVGSSKSFTVQVNSSGGFQGQVNLTCNAVTGLTCQLTPNQVTLTSGGSATASLNISVAAKPAIVPINWPGIFGTGHQRQRLILFVLVVLLAIWVRAARHGEKSVAGIRLNWSYQAIFLALLLLALGVSSCGGGGTVGGGGGGGGTTVTSVGVQGTAGGTTVTLGSVSVTIP